MVNRAADRSRSVSTEVLEKPAQNRIKAELPAAKTRARIVEVGQSNSWYCFCSVRIAPIPTIGDCGNLVHGVNDWGRSSLSLSKRSTVEALEEGAA